MVRKEHICWACSQKMSAGPLLIHDLQLNLVRYVWAGCAAYHSASGNRVNKYFFQHHLSCGILLSPILLLGRTQKCRNLPVRGEGFIPSAKQ